MILALTAGEILGMLVGIMRHLMLAFSVLFCGVLFAADEAAPATAKPTPRPNPIAPIKAIMDESESKALQEIYKTYFLSQKDADEAGKKAAAIKCFDDEVALFDKVIVRVKAAGGDIAQAQEASTTFVAKKDEMIGKILESAKPKPTP